MADTTAVQANAQQLVRVFDGVIGGVPAQVVNGRELHTFLKAGWQFSDWIKKRIEQYGFEQDQDFVCVSVKTETHRKDGQRGVTKSNEYHLTLDTAKELAMVENNDQGRQVRRYFIAMERQARESRGATYLSLNQQLAIHRQVPKLLSQLKAETTPAIRATLHAQLAQHCHLLAIPVPPIHNVGRAAPENGELFPVAKG